MLDIADAANQFAPVLPPVSVAGLPRTGGARQAVGLYGTGLTQVMALPLQSRDAGYLADQLRTSGASGQPTACSCCGSARSASA